MSDPSNRIHEYDETDLVSAELPRQRSARNDSEMRDGSDGAPAVEDRAMPGTTDSDIGDAVSEEAGVLNAVPAQADGGHDTEAILEAEPDLGAREPRGDAARPSEMATRRRREHEIDRTESDIPRRGHDAPIDGYKELTVPQIMARIETMSRDEMRAVQRYEEQHRRRKTLLVRLERRLREPRPEAGEHRSEARDLPHMDRSRSMQS